MTEAIEIGNLGYYPSEYVFVGHGWNTDLEMINLREYNANVIMISEPIVLDDEPERNHIRLLNEISKEKYKKTLLFPESINNSYCLYTKEAPNLLLTDFQKNTETNIFANIKTKKQDENFVLLLSDLLKNISRQEKGKQFLLIVYASRTPIDNFEYENIETSFRNGDKIKSFIDEKGIKIETPSNQGKNRKCDINLKLDIPEIAELRVKKEGVRQEFNKQIDDSLLTKIKTKSQEMEKKLDNLSPKWKQNYETLYYWIGRVHNSIFQKFDLDKTDEKAVLLLARILLTTFLLQQNNIDITNLQKNGFATYSIALKYLIDDANKIPLAEVGEYYSNENITKTDIYDAELFILDSINWQIPYFDYVEDRASDITTTIEDVLPKPTNVKVTIAKKPVISGNLSAYLASQKVPAAKSSSKKRG
jgi:hypothetical protein